MAGWHHQVDGHEFEQTLGVCDGEGGLVCCGSWGHKELDTTEQLNNNNNNNEMSKIGKSIEIESRLVARD